MITEGNIREIYDITGLTPLAGGYEFTFPYTSAQDVRVYTTGNRTDTEVSTSNYTIDESGATPKVVFIAGYSFPAGQTKLTIIRNVSYSQKLDLRNGDLIDADKLEGALDNITQQIQQVAEKVDRAILSSVSDTEPLSIPEASQRNNMLLGFDSEGKAIPVLTTDIEQKLAQALAAEESAITAKNAAENAQHEAESAQSAAETAQGKAETAQAAAESAEASSQTLLASIETKTEESIASINTTKTGAVGAVTTQQATSVAAVQAAQNTAESDIAGKRSSALTAIDTAKTTAVAAVNTQKETSVAAADREIVAKRDSALTDIQTARTNAVNAITTKKDQSLQEVEQLASERKAEINSLAANQKADVKQYTDSVVASAKTEIDTEKTTAVTAVQEEGDAKVAIIGSSGDAEVTRVQSVYQTDLNELKGDLGELINKEFEVESTGFIKDDLNVVQSLGWNITKPIMVYKNVKYFFKSINYTAVSAITECLEDGTLLRVLELGQFIDDNTPTTISFTPSNDTYVKLSYNNNYSPYFYTMYKIENLERYSFITLDNESIIKQNITENIGMNRFNQNSSVRGFISQDGKTITVYEDWMTTDYIHVNNMKQVYISADYNGDQIPLKAFFFTIYDENKEVINRFDEMETPYTIIDRVHYIRFSYHDNITNLMVTDGSATPLDYSAYNAKNVIGNKVWQNKKWCTIGDSLTQHNERTRFNYHDYVSKNTGIEVINLGSSGKGYMAGGSEDAFYHIALSVPCDSDVVTIFGSGNDLSYGYELGEITDTGTSTICGCINTTIDTIISRLPRVSLGIVTPTPWQDYPPNVKNNLMEEYSNAIIEICRNRSIPCLDLYHESNLRPWTEEGRIACYSNDDGGGVHPDEYGHKLIAPRFKAFLETLLL